MKAFQPSEEEIQWFKSNVIVLMESANPKVNQTISELIYIVTSEGYLEVWPDLMSLIAAQLSKNDPTLSSSFYLLVHKLTKRYRNTKSTNSLIKEIIESIKQLFSLMIANSADYLGWLAGNSLTVQQKEIVFFNLHLIFKIHFSFHYQDFPEMYEDNLEAYLSTLMNAFNLKQPDFPQETIKLKALVLKNLNLFCQNYFEDFKKFHDNFVQPVWNLLGEVDNSQTCLKLNQHLLKYFEILFKFERFPNFSQETATEILNKLVINNIFFSQAELAKFDDNPEAFVTEELDDFKIDIS